jgi:hypothetical protein
MGKHLTDRNPRLISSAPNSTVREAQDIEPIRAVLERGESRSARRMLDEALSHLPAMPTTSEQAETLRLLFDAVLPGDHEIWSLLVGHLVKRCPAHSHWRAARAHLRAIAALKERDRSLAETLVAALAPGPTARRALRLLERCSSK